MGTDILTDPPANRNFFKRPATITRRSRAATKKISPQRHEATKIDTGKNVVDLCVLRVSHEMSPDLTVYSRFRGIWAAFSSAVVHPLGMKNSGRRDLISNIGRAILYPLSSILGTIQV